MQTGTLKIVRPGQGSETLSWNGEVADREKAKAAFELALASGGYIAAVAKVENGTKMYEQVTSFVTVEEVEKEQGEVEVRMVPQIAGGQ